MEAVDFPKTNVTLGAGNNPNTSPLRIALCNNAQMPNYKQGFLVSKWQMNEEEKYFLKNRLLQFLEVEQVEKVLDSLPPVFLACMHSMSPVMVLQYPEDWIFDGTFLNPDKAAADRVNSKRYKEN